MKGTAGAKPSALALRNSTVGGELAKCTIELYLLVLLQRRIENLLRFNQRMMILQVSNAIVDAAGVTDTMTTVTLKCMPLRVNNAGQNSARIVLRHT